MEGLGKGARFVVLDGLDGCGKSTQAARLAAWLSQRSGREALHLREPGSTAAGERIRALLLEREVGLTPASQVLLFAAARRQMLDELVRPALAAGRSVVCERFHPSTFAYQGTAGGVDEERLLALLLAWAGTPAPASLIWRTKSAHCSRLAIWSRRSISGL
ncbi:MAG: dTMP kinase, partial [Planctomycetota bacterium]